MSEEFNPPWPTNSKWVTTTAFRKRMAYWINWVEFVGGRLWLTKNGKITAVLVTTSDVKKLERYENRTLDEERRRVVEHLAAVERFHKIEHEKKYGTLTPEFEPTYHPKLED